jgi:amino acid transporter
LAQGSCLVVQTFGAYTLQVVDLGPAAFWVPTLGVILLAAALAVNVASNRLIESTAAVMAIIKIGGLAVFAIVGLSLVDLSSVAARPTEDELVASPEGFVAAVALAILAYKGFTTITNSGGEIVGPHRNTGRAIVISLAICSLLYLLIDIAVHWGVLRHLRSRIKVRPGIVAVALLLDVAGVNPKAS